MGTQTQQPTNQYWNNESPSYGGISQWGTSTPTLNYNNLANSITSGTSLSGQKLPTFQMPSAYQYSTPSLGNSYQFSQPSYNYSQYTQPTQYQAPNYQQFKYKLPDISNVPQEAYQGVLNRGLEGIQQDQSRFGQQAAQQFGQRNIGQSGLAQGAQNTLGREAMQQASNLRSNVGLQQAQSQLQNAQYMVPYGLQQQQLQAGEGQYATGLNQWLQQQQGAENLARAGYGMQGAQYGAGLNQWQQAQQAAEYWQRQQAGAGLSQWQQQQQAGENTANANLGLTAQQALSGLNLQNIGALGTLQGQAYNQAMAPYQNLMNLYSQNLGVPGTTSSGGGDLFGALLGAAGTVAPMMCLPSGTLIELANGDNARVEDLKVGDDVVGGKIIATHSRKRSENHQFYRHIFNTGAVVMSDGHPYHDTLVGVNLVDHGSPNTYDILTDQGFYLVNGVKLGSTISRI